MDKKFITKWPLLNIEETVLIGRDKKCFRIMDKNGCKRFIKIGDYRFFDSKKEASKYLIEKIKISNSVLNDRIKENNKIIKMLNQIN